ncbi:MAG: TetR/AcrR family transcriptional regulator [Candidatus Omnitrophota bacterium]|jgi:AcrR family transcriptional regulator
MNSSPKASRPTREETQDRILTKADELFRQYGFGKTTVADIAQELDMSPANIYKFFVSKDALVQASAERSLSLVRKKVLSVVQSRRSALRRLEGMVLVIFRFHQDLFHNERHIFKMVLQAHQEAWKSIDSYNAFLFQTTGALLEEGIASGEIRKGNSAALTPPLLDALHVALHPYLRPSWSPDEKEHRVRAHIRFVLASLG